MLIYLLLVVVPLPFEILKLNMHSNITIPATWNILKMLGLVAETSHCASHKHHVISGMWDFIFSMHLSVHQSDPCHDNEAAQEQRNQQQQHVLLLLAACGPGWSLGIKKNSS